MFAIITISLFVASLILKDTSLLIPSGLFGIATSISALVNKADSKSEKS